MKHYIKSALMLLGALAAIALFLWAGHTSTHPGKPLQLILLYAISAFVLAATIMFAVDEAKEGKKERKRGKRK